jgi:hypothetical protein
MSNDQEQFDPVNFLLAYDTGSLSPEHTALGFQRLIDSGDVWRLEGRYGKVARELIDRGECNTSATHLAQTTDKSAVGPYVNVSRNATRQVGGDEFRVVLYGAYDAMGLVGSECNGIVVMSEPSQVIVTDELAIESTGSLGPSKAQIEMFDKLMTCPDEEFRKIVNTSANVQIKIDAPAPTGPRTPRP